jgi:hypothetical protein
MTPVDCLLSTSKGHVAVDQTTFPKHSLDRHPDGRRLEESYMSAPEANAVFHRVWRGFPKDLA